MGQSGFRIGEGEARHDRGLGLAPAQIEVAEVADEARQYIQDLPRRRNGEVGRDRVGVDVPEALERVRQSVQASRQCQAARGADGDRRIDDCDLGIKGAVGE